jgi:DNA-binding GntR family transcriptional regulator
MSEPIRDFRVSELRAHREAARRRAFYGSRPALPDQPETSARRAYELLRTMLRVGQLSTGRSLQEDALAATLGASRNAVRKALQQLADEGLLVRQQKSGTRLVHEMIHVDGGQVVPRGMALGLDGGRLTISQARIETVMLSPVVQMKLETDAQVGILSESRFFVDDVPISLRIGYVSGDPEAVTRSLSSFSTDNPPPYPDAFRALYDAEFGSSHSTVEAISCEERTAEILGIEVGSPILLNEVVVRDIDGVARELSYTYYRSDRVAVASVNLSPPSSL